MVSPSPATASAQPWGAASGAGPAPGTGGFHLPALLVRLTVGLPSLPLRPAAWKQQEKGELRQAVMGGWVRTSGGKRSGKHRIPAALPSVTCVKWIYLFFFFTFLSKAGVRLGMAEGAEGGGDGGLRPGQGERGE